MIAADLGTVKRGFIAVAVMAACFFHEPLWAQAALEPGAPDPPSIPFKQEDAVGPSLTLKVIIVTFFCVVLAVAAAWLVRKRFYGKTLVQSAGARIQLHDFKRLTPKLNVFVVGIDEKDYVIVQSGEQVTLTPHRSVPKHNEKS